MHESPSAPLSDLWAVAAKESGMRDATESGEQIRAHQVGLVMVVLPYQRWIFVVPPKSGNMVSHMDIVVMVVSTWVCKRVVGMVWGTKQVDMSVLRRWIGSWVWKWWISVWV